MQGKAWLLDNIKNVDRNTRVLVVGSWLGFTSYCLYKEGFKFITETDIDSRLEKMARHVNMSNDTFKHLNNDVNELDLSSYGLIINTSCEHIEDNRWFDNVKSGTTLALQSTNFKCPDHVNTVNNLEEMKRKYPLKYSYADDLVFNPMFTRYMVVGEKM
jgi:predicted nicotinamide N-methyase